MLITKTKYMYLANVFCLQLTRNLYLTLENLAFSLSAFSHLTKWGRWVCPQVVATKQEQIPSKETKNTESD